MTAVEVYQGGLGESIVVFGNLADQIARTEFVPQEFRGRPEAVLACMLFGQECGLGPMASLNLTQNIKGKVGLKPEGMRAVVQSHGHRIWTEEYTDEAVTLCGQRKGEEHVAKVRWTLADAKRAQLTSNPSWNKYPRAMLMARATSELCRLHFSDATGGMAYAADELEEIAAHDVALPRRAGGEPGSASAAPARANTARPGPRQAVDTTTGEVVDSGGAPSTGTRKRRPPTAPAEPVTVEVVEPVEADPPPSAQQVADIRRRLERLTGQDRAAVRAAWQERVGQAFLHDGEVHPQFSAVHAARALALLEDFSTLPTTDEPAPTLDSEAPA